MRWPLHHSHRQKLYAVLFALLLASIPLIGAAQTPLSVGVVRVESPKFPQVQAQLTVEDEKGLPVLGLTPQNLILTEDGREIKSVNLSPLVTVDDPMVVTLVIDVSNSMAGRPLEDAKLAASNFVNELGASDLAAVIAFAGTVVPVANFTRDKETLKGAIQSLVVGPETALYDAVAGAARATANYPTGRKVILLMTDGEDTKSQYTFAEALQIATATHVPVYTVGLGKEVDRQILDNIARSTGGKSLYAPTSRDLSESYKAVALQLRSRYIVTFQSGLMADGRTHSLAVRVKHQGKEADGRGEFIATLIPPAITVTSPTDGIVVSRTATLEARVTAVAPPVKVDFTVDGKVVSSANAEPFTYRWYTDLATPGRHVLGVTATDSVGNQGSKMVSVIVPELATSPTPAPSPTTTPASATPLSEGGGSWPLILAILVVVVVPVALIRSKRQKRSVRRAQSRQFRLPNPFRKNKCPVCGRVYNPKGICSFCQEQEQKAISQRLRQIFDDKDESE